MTTGTLPGSSERLLSEFDDSDARLKRPAEGLSPTQLNWPPRPGAWSVGRCIEHLAIANEVYIPAIASALVNRQPDGPVDQIVIGRFAGYFIRTFIEPTPTTGARRRRERSRPPHRLST